MSRDRASLLLAFVFSMTLFISGCATNPVVVKDNYDYSSVKKITVLALSDYPSQSNSGEIMSGLLAKYLMKYGFDVVEREDLEKVIGEQKLSLSGLIGSGQIKEIGKISGIDAIVMGEVSLFVPERKEVVLTREVTSETRLEPKDKNEAQKKEKGTLIALSGPVTEDVVTVTKKTEREVPVTVLINAEVGMTCKMVSVETGDVIWVASDTYEGVNTQVASEYMISYMVKNLAKELTKRKGRK